MLVMFFFSSRRRHTRYWRDWSSDVCSSDLAPAEDQHRGAGQDRRSDRRGGGGIHPDPHGAKLRPGGVGGRSEERRVGKECRSRWATDLEKKNGEVTRPS